MDIEHIISEVFSRPALWNKKHKSYHNRVLVEKLWISIATALKVPKEGLKKKWKNIRDQFRYELRKIPISTPGDAGDSEAQLTSSWPYFQSLLFLKDQMKYRGLNCSLKPAKAKSNQKETAIEFQEENEDICNTSQFENSDDMCNSSEFYSELSTHNKSTANSSAQRLEMKKRNLDMLEKETSGHKPVLDEDEAFFLTLLPHIRKLQPENKFLCRMEIQNVLYKYVYGKKPNLPQMTNRHFQPSSFAPMQIANLPSTSSSFDPIQITNEPSTSSPLDPFQIANEIEIKQSCSRSLSPI